MESAYSNSSSSQAAQKFPERAAHAAKETPAKEAFSADVLTPILKVQGLIKNYGKRRVVDGVSFHVNPGEIVGLLGPNGAGKTTSFRMTCGLIKTNGGVVYLSGRDVTQLPMYRRALEGGMGYLPQAESVFRGLSVQDNLLSMMELLGMERARRMVRCEELLEKFRLTHLRHNLGGGLSGGERRRLEIARALVAQPRIMLLDEPFANIDPITVKSIQDIIRQLSLEGIAILITDHQVRETLQITQRGYIIRAGQVLCQGTPEEILAHPEARKVYFGEDVGVNEIISPRVEKSIEKEVEKLANKSSSVILPRETREDSEESSHTSHKHHAHEAHRVHDAHRHEHHHHPKHSETTLQELLQESSVRHAAKASRNAFDSRTFTSTPTPSTPTSGTPIPPRPFTTNSSNSANVASAATPASLPPIPPSPHNRYGISTPALTPLARTNERLSLSTPSTPNEPAQTLRQRIHTFLWGSR